VDDDILEALEVDFRPISSSPPAGYRPEIFDEGDYEAYIDEWGVKRRRPKVGGHYFDGVEQPIRESTLAALDRYRWPDPDDPSRYRGLGQQAQALRQQTPYAVVGRCEMGSDVLSGFQWVRGFAESMLDLAANPAFAEAFLDRLTDIAIRAWGHFLAEVGEHVDVVTFFEDLGMQDRLLISPAMYRRLLKPRHARIIAAIKARTKAKVFFHTDGAVLDLIPDLIEIGVDILNPIQVSAKGMGDTAELKRRFGRQLVFWGGACDSQSVLPFGTADEVREETQRRIADLAPGGGFIFAPVHNLQDDVSPDKILTLYRTALECGCYPIKAG
jgi:uroporphyrinogen decarboxylase